MDGPYRLTKYGAKDRKKGHYYYYYFKGELELRVCTGQGPNGQRLINKEKIIEKGNHSELIKLKGRYFELYNMQINPEMSIK